MKRLVDTVHDPRSAEHFLAAAIRSTPRADPQPFEMQRFLARVGSTKSSRSLLTLRFLVAAAAVLLAVSAAAAISIRVHRSLAANRALGAPPPTAAPILAAPTLAAPVPSVAAAAPPEPPASASVVLPSTRVATPARGGEDPTAVLQAIRALRGSGDAERASALLSQYLRAHPRGVLSEDALALSIEAANARHDARSAAVLGRRYLEQFPAGRYRAFAQQATQPPAR